MDENFIVESGMYFVKTKRIYGTKNFIWNGKFKLRTEQWSSVRNETLTYLEERERMIFFAFFILIFVVAFFGNTYAIYKTIKRKHRAIQKTCIISLCLSDLAMSIAYTVNYLETFSHPLINWTLGSFFCSFIPWIQTFGITASSAMLVAIAWDRYRNVVHAIKKKWNPSLVKCVLGTVILWIACAALSFPSFVFFDLKRIIVVYTSPENVPLTREEMFVCITDRKDDLMIYNVCMAILIFLPLMFLFLWLYYNIALLIWKHRKPLSIRFKKTEDTSQETVTSQIRSSEEISKITSSAPAVNVKLNQKSIHVERKIRTFKIIISLMVVFFLLRIPYWTFNTMKLIGTYTQKKHWIMTYVFNGLALLNCAVNPFLYVFLNLTIRIKKTIYNFICEICCCCFSNREFDEFEKEENPFYVQNYGRKSIQKQITPFSVNGKQYKVTFEEFAHPNLKQDCYKKF